MTSPKPTVTATPASHDNDAIVAFPAPNPAAGRYDAWITIDPADGQPLFALKITRTDEGLVFDIWPEGREDTEPAATTYVFFTDAAEEVNA